MKSARTFIMNPTSNRVAEKEEEQPKDKPYIDLGEKSKCLGCDSRFCICKERQNGTWENDLPIYYPPKE